MARAATPAARKRQIIGPVPTTEINHEMLEVMPDPVFDTGDMPTNEPVPTNGIEGSQLRSFIERIERLSEEKKSIADDIKEVFAEARGTGFEPRIMRMLIKIRRMDKDDLDEQETMLDIYKRAVGMAP